jgi:hypothetical protein
MYPNHETDFYGWTQHTAELLREQRLSELDLENVLEEIEALGRSEKHELINRLSVLLSHLLKWQFQKTMQGHSWRYTIEEQRTQVKLILEDNPSLKPQFESSVAKAYKIAIVKATKETSLPKTTFPSLCPYTPEEIVDDEFLPE